MATSGGQPGNQNAAKGAEWRQAIKRALARRSGKTYREGLDEVADKFTQAAADGDAWAMKEIGDRIDGKPRQGIEHMGEGGGPIDLKTDWTIQPVVPLDETDTEG